MQNVHRFLRRMWHSYFMKHNFSLYETSADPTQQEKYYKKASFHANQLLRS